MKKGVVLFVALLFFWLINFSSAQTQYYGDYSDVLLVCNANSSASQEICSYFIEKRVPLNFNISHVVNLTGITTSETLSSWQQYTSLINQINSTLQSSGEINYIVTTIGVPLKVYNSSWQWGTYRSLDSRIMYEFMNTSRGWYDKSNPFYNKEDIFTHNNYGSYLVTRLTGYTTQDAKDLVDRSTSAKSNGTYLFNSYQNSTTDLQGNVFYYWDYGLTDAQTILENNGVTGSYVNDSFVKNVHNLTAYASWGSNACGIGSGNPVCANSSAWNFSFNPGALAETFVSTSGRTFATYPWNGGQSYALDLIKQGVTGTKGYVAEPYLDAIAYVPILFDRYYNGYNLADSFYMASANCINWMDVVIGDPKTAIIKVSNSPSISLTFPLNGERINNGTRINISVSLDKFSVLDKVWYSYNGTNLTLSSPYSIDTSSWSFGQKNISVYSNNTQGKIALKQYSVYINSTIGDTPKYSYFDGQTTDLKMVADKTNISGLILEKETVGRIEFLENINVSGLDLDKYITLTQNYVYINSSAIPNLNKSANITLYNRPGVWSNNVILRDNLVCNSTTSPKCVNLTALNSDYVKFNVSQFSEYEISGDLLSGCTTLSQANQYYQLISNITATSTCLTIGADNITIEGNGYSLIGKKNILAITSTGRKNLTIRNLNIVNFSNAIYLSNTDNSNFQNIKVSQGNGTYNIYNVGGATNNTFLDIFVFDGNYTDCLGVYSEDSDYTNVTNFEAYNNIVNGDKSLWGIIYGGAGLGIYQSKNIVYKNINIHDNKFLKINGDGGSVVGETATNSVFGLYNWQDILVENNNVSYNGNTYGLIGARILTHMVNSTIRNISVKNNRVENTGTLLGKALILGAISYGISNVSDIRVENNFINVTQRDDELATIISGNVKDVLYQVHNNHYINNYYTATSCSLDSRPSILQNALFNTLNATNNVIEIKNFSCINHSFSLVQFSSYSPSGRLLSGIYLKNNSLLVKNVINGTSLAIREITMINLQNETNLTNIFVEDNQPIKILIDSLANRTNQTYFGYKNSYAEISFGKELLSNLTFYSNLSESNILLSDKFVSINSTAIPELNKSANITFYSVNFTGFKNLRILKDGAVSTDYYNFTPLDAETVKFNVSGFSNYTLTGDDAVSPSINFLSSLVTNQSVAILFNVTDNGILKNCTVEIGEKMNYTTTIGNPNPLSISGLQSSTYYSANLTCTDLAENSNSTLISFTTNANPATETETSSSSGGSAPSKVVSLASIQSGEAQTLAYGTKLIFSFKSENHTIWLRQINRDKAEIVIDVYSEKQNVSLAVGETKEVDLDGDGVNDYKITLLKVYSNSVKVDLKIELIGNVVKEENKTSVGETIKNVVTEVKENNYSGLIIGILILVLVVVGLLVLWKKKLSHDYRFRLLVNKIKYSSKH